MWPDTQVAVEKRLLLVLQDLFSAGPNKVRVSSAAQYLTASQDGGSDRQALPFAEVCAPRGQSHAITTHLYFKNGIAPPSSVGI